MVELLSQELMRRQERNPRYSMRAFAEFLDIESSYLSKILAKKRPLNAELTHRFARRLGFSEFEAREIVSEQLLTAGTRNLNFGTALVQAFPRLNPEIFEMISDNTHYAILESLKLKAFVPDEKWLARHLRQPLDKIKQCVNRLVEAGLLDVSDPTQWVDRSGGASSHVYGNNITSLAHKKSQEQILQRSLEALFEVEIENRDHSSMMMATSQSKLEEAKERIRKFRRELCEFLADTTEPDTVYQLSIGLFPISEKAPVSPWVTGLREKFKCV